MNSENNLTAFEQDESEVYILRLFITGTSAVSVRAINNLQKILQEYLANRYELEIIDAHQQPLLVETDNVTAVPMLIVKKQPAPLRRLVGDMSDKERVLKGLGIIQLEF